MAQEKKALADKKNSRFPAPVVPGAFYEMTGLDEKDKENSVVRLVAYKNQMDDVTKILRKAGVAARVFNHNTEKYQNDKKQRHILAEQLKQKTSKLHATSAECF